MDGGRGRRKGDERMDMNRRIDGWVLDGVVYMVDRTGLSHVTAKGKDTISVHKSG